MLRKCRPVSWLILSGSPLYVRQYNNEVPNRAPLLNNRRTRSANNCVSKAKRLRTPCRAVRTLT
jgi:hypothetical protein